jgi:hypothetical protein
VAWFVVDVVVVVVVVGGGDVDGKRAVVARSGAVFAAEGVDEAVDAGFEVDAGRTVAGAVGGWWGWVVGGGYAACGWAGGEGAALGGAALPVEPAHFDVVRGGHCEDVMDEVR